MSQNLNCELRLAAERGYLDACKQLVTAGAHVNLRDQQGDTPLHHAAEFDREDVVRFLIESGADPTALSANDETPMHLAVKNGRVGACRVLAELGLDPSYRPSVTSDELYLTPFQTAVRFGQVDVAVMFVDEFDADPDSWSCMPPEAEDEERMRMALLGPKAAREVRLGLGGAEGSAQNERRRSLGMSPI